MDLIPAIDLLGGQVVRLRRGRYDEVTVYDDDPVRVALGFEREGATRLHIVDLQGARTGAPEHVAAIRAILDATSLAVQVGGGIRTRDTVERWLDAGAARVVLGTMVIKAPETAQTLCREHPGQTIVAIDARDGWVAVEGWREQSGQEAIELARRVDAWGAAAILYTNIDRDGTHDGPDVDGTVKMQRHVQATVIASGGIGSLADLRALADAGVHSAVCGRALYSGTFTLSEGFAALQSE